jgi:hypothetical protein
LVEMRSVRPIGLLVLAAALAGPFVAGTGTSASGAPAANGRGSAGRGAADTRSVAAIDAKPASAGARGTRNVIVLVGDSVPEYMWRAFSDAARTYGYGVVSAAIGSCPATGALVVDENGAPNKSNCPKAVPRRQDSVVQQFRPALVIWWSRYELADRRSADGRHLVTGSHEYWREQQLAFEHRVKQLTSLGAKVVAVEIEPLGIGVNDRCARLQCGPLIHRLAFETVISNRWNWFLARHRGPTVFSISIDDAVCHDRARPCDDRLPNGELARVDGVHYVPAAKDAVAKTILRAALRVSGVTPSRA